MKRLVSRALVLLLVLAVAGEIGLRLWDAFVRRVPTGALYDWIVPTGTRFKLRPDSAVLVPERYGDVLYRFNHEGYRDVDHDPASPRRRIVWLGDSVSFGLGVQQEKTFVGRLQRELAARPDPWEIVNLAIFAYDTRHELETLKEDGLRHRPDLLVLQFYMNDLTLSTPSAQGGTIARVSWGDRLAALKNRLVYKSVVYLRVQQALLGLSYALFHDARRRWFPETLNADEPRSQTAYLAAHPDDAQVPTFAALTDIARIAKENGVPLLVFVSPDEVQLTTDRYDLVNRRVDGFCAKEGIAVFDPLPILRAAPARRDLYYDGVHYSERGHALLARLFSAELRGYLSRPPSRR